MDTEVPVDQLQNLPRFSWLVRRCEIYKEEYGDCKSIKSKFHQYFINGETQDCSQWNTDYQQCLLFRNNNDLNALTSVIESERDRREERLKGHYANDVWERRDEPPKDWNKPLPQYLIKDPQLSFLSMKTKEEENGAKNNDEQKSMCTIS